MPDVELGREYVRERVRALLDDTSDSDVMTGMHGDLAVTFSYSSDDANPPETHVAAELPKHHGLELRLERRDREPRDTFNLHGYAGTAAPLTAARILLDKPTCERLLEQRVSALRIAPFDIKDYLPRGTLRLIERTSPEHQDLYRSTYEVSLTVRGWIEDPERAVATIALAVDLASRVSDAVTRAAGAELATGPYRDAPGASSHRPADDDRHGVRRIVAATYTLLSRAVAGWWPF
jgi:hypothetical protein